MEKIQIQNKTKEWKATHKDQIRETLKKWTKCTRKCQICDRCYTNATYYQHLKSKKHAKNVLKYLGIPIETLELRLYTTNEKGEKCFLMAEEIEKHNQIELAKYEK